MDMASSYTNGTTTISSYAKAVLRSRSENSNEIVMTRGSRGTSSLGDSDGHDDTTDWQELNYKQKDSNPWHINPSAAAVIAMKFPPTAVSDTLNDSNSSSSHKSSSSGKGSVQMSSSSSSSSYSSTSSAKSESSSSEKNVGISRSSGSVNKSNKVFSGSPIKSSSHTKSGDSSSLLPRNNIGRGRGRGGVGRGRGNYRGKNYYHHNQSYYPDDSSVTPSTREDYKDFPPDFTTLTPMYAPVSDYIMPYLATFQPSATAFTSTSLAPPLETGILTLTAEEQSFPFVTVDAMTIEMVKNQIEYYFSEENLEKDFYLRRKMDSEGYLPVQLIASFHRVKSYDYSVVVAAIQSSEKLELTEDMAFVRTVNTPTKWPILDSVVLLIKAMKIDPMLPSSSTVDTELDDGIMSTASPIDSAIPSPSNVINLQSTMVSANGNEMFNPNVPEFVPQQIKYRHTNIQTEKI